MGLFAGTTYEQDDEEADQIYDEVDKAMDSRRKARRFVIGQFRIYEHLANSRVIQGGS